MPDQRTEVEPSGVVPVAKERGHPVSAARRKPHTPRRSFSIPKRLHTSHILLMGDTPVASISFTAFARKAATKMFSLAFRATLAG